MSFAILSSLHSIIKRSLHLLRRLHSLHRDVGHHHTGTVAIENLLHQSQSIKSDFFTTFIEHEVHLALANNFTNGCFGHLFDRLFLLAIIEDPIRRIFEAILNSELDVNDIFVVGQHQSFACEFVAHIAAITHLDSTDLGDIDGLMRLNRIRPAPIETGGSRMTELAKGQDNTRLTFLHNEKSTDKPQEKNHHGDNTRADTCTSRVAWRAAAITAATTTFSAEEPVQTLVEITPQLIKIRRTIAGPLVVAPRLLIVVLRPTSPARIIERKFQTEFFEN